MGSFRTLTTFSVHQRSAASLDLSGYYEGSFVFAAWQIAVANFAARCVSSDDHSPALFL